MSLWFSYGFPMESWWIHHRILSIGISTIGNPPMVNILGEIHEFSLLRGPVDRAPRAGFRHEASWCSATPSPSCTRWTDGPTRRGPQGAHGDGRGFLWWFSGGSMVVLGWQKNDFFMVLWWFYDVLWYMDLFEHGVHVYPSPFNPILGLSTSNDWEHMWKKERCTDLVHALENQRGWKIPELLNGGFPGENHP